MKLLFQTQFSTMARRESGQVLAETFYLSSDYEAVGRVAADKDTFLIKKVRWDIYRSPDQTEPYGHDVAELYGQEAYFQIGEALSKAFAKQDAFAKELIAECVRGIIQAETYLFRERGYPTAESYDDAWETMFVDTCRYYSNLDRVGTKWREHVGSRTRGAYLFHRSKSCLIHEAGAGLAITGAFIDSFHHMGLSFIITNGIITSCEGNLLRAPDPVCFECRRFFDEFIGLNFQQLAKKDLAAIIGSSHGCTHLVDVFYECKRSYDRFCSAAISG